MHRVCTRVRIGSYMVWESRRQGLWTTITDLNHHFPVTFTADRRQPILQLFPYWGCYSNPHSLHSKGSKCPQTRTGTGTFCCKSSEHCNFVLKSNSTSNSCCVVLSYSNQEQQTFNIVVIVSTFLHKTKVTWLVLPTNIMPFSVQHFNWDAILHSCFLIVFLACFVKIKILMPYIAQHFI